MADPVAPPRPRGHRIADAIALPAPAPASVEAVAAREDRYTVEVVDGFEALVERVAALSLTGRAGIVTDVTRCGTGSQRSTSGAATCCWRSAAA